jgi:hypothetical protein
MTLDSFWRKVRTRNYFYYIAVRLSNHAPLLRPPKSQMIRFAGRIDPQVIE